MQLEVSPQAQATCSCARSGHTTCQCESAQRFSLSPDLDMSRRRPGTAQATPDPVSLPPAPPPSETVLKLRKDVRIAQISQFILTFGPHVNLDFDIDVSSYPLPHLLSLEELQQTDETGNNRRVDGSLATLSARRASLVACVNLARNVSLQDLEADLEGSRPGCCIPTLLGKLCNTLANDRNTK